MTLPSWSILPRQQRVQATAAELSLVRLGRIVIFVSLPVAFADTAVFGYPLFSLLIERPLRRVRGGLVAGHSDPVASRRFHLALIGWGLAAVYAGVAVGSGRMTSRPVSPVTPPRSGRGRAVLGGSPPSSHNPRPDQVEDRLWEQILPHSGFDRERRQARILQCATYLTEAMDRIARAEVWPTRTTTRRCPSCASPSTPATTDRHRHRHEPRRHQRHHHQPAEPAGAPGGTRSATPTHGPSLRARHHHPGGRASVERMVLARTRHANNGLPRSPTSSATI